MARTPFKLKSSPAKGKLQDFFNTVGSQLRSNKRDIGADLKEKYNRTKESTPKAGESKYQASVRTRKAARKLKPEVSKAKGNATLNNKSDKEIKVKGAGTNSYNTETSKAPKVRVNSGSLHTDLPSQKGDPYEYQVSDNERSAKSGKESSRTIWYKDTRKGKDSEWVPTMDGDQDSKAILARYTGSETGDISKWVDNPWKSSTSGAQRITNPDGGKAKIYSGSQDKLESNSHLTYDQMQALNNPIKKKSPSKKRGFRMNRKK